MYGNPRFPVFRTGVGVLTALELELELEPGLALRVVATMLDELLLITLDIVLLYDVVLAV